MTSAPRFYSPVLGRFLSADTIVPEPGDPQSLNRYSYVYNRPTVLTDPSGHCPVCIILGLGALAAAVDLFTVPDTAYAPELSVDLAALPPSAAPAGQHAVALVGTALGGVGAVKAGAVLLGPACADGSCTNEAQGVVQAAQKTGQVSSTTAEPATASQGLNAFTRAAEYGIRSYDHLHGMTSGTGLQAHHLIEKRFAERLGLEGGELPSIVLTAQEHQVFTNQWRNAIGYDNMRSVITTSSATLDDIWVAAQNIYQQHPELLEAIRQSLGK